MAVNSKRYGALIGLAIAILGAVGGATDVVQPKYAAIAAAVGAALAAFSKAIFPPASGE